MLISLFTVLIPPYTLHLQPSTPRPPQDEAHIRRQIIQSVSALKTLQCDFVQTRQMRMLSDKMESQGRLYYQQPDKLRWEYAKPYAFTFILNGPKMVLSSGRDRETVDASQNKMFREMARMMLNSLVGNSLSDEKDFRTRLAATPTEWVATLEPQRRDIRQMMRQIVIHFNRKQSIVACIELIENGGDQTIIQLKNIKTNKPLGKALFTVDGPARK